MFDYCKTEPPPSRTDRENETILMNRYGCGNSEARTHLCSFMNSTQRNKVFCSSSPFPGDKRSQPLKSVLVNLPFEVNKFAAVNIAVLLGAVMSKLASYSRQKQENKQKQKTHHIIY